MATSPSSGLAPGALIDLARFGYAVEQLVDVIRLTRDLRARGASTADLDDVRRLREGLLPEARRQADQLLGFFETYQDTLDAAAREAVAAGRKLSSRTTDDFGRRGVESLRALVERLAADDRGADHVSLCEAYDALIFREDVQCIAGSALHCAKGEVWLHLAREDGCR